MSEEDDLCNYCPLDEEFRGCNSSLNNCDGSKCDEAEENKHEAEMENMVRHLRIFGMATRAQEMRIAANEALQCVIEAQEIRDLQLGKSLEAPKVYFGDLKSGKEKRRDRRKKNRTK